MRELGLGFECRCRLGKEAITRTETKVSVQFTGVFINGEVGVGVGAIDDDIDVHVKGKQEQGQKDIL